MNANPYAAKIAAEINGISEEEARLRAFHQRHIVHFDNLLYQNELGLLAKDDVARVTGLILAQFPTWKSSGSLVLTRVEDWYESHRDA